MTTSDLISGKTFLPHAPGRDLRLLPDFSAGIIHNLRCPAGVHLQGALGVITDPKTSETATFLLLLLLPEGILSPLKGQNEVALPERERRGHLIPTVHTPSGHFNPSESTAALWEGTGNIVASICSSFLILFLSSFLFKIFGIKLPPWLSGWFFSRVYGLLYPCEFD